MKNLKYLFFCSIFIISSCSTSIKKSTIKFDIESHLNEVEVLTDKDIDPFDFYSQSALETKYGYFYDDLAFNSKVDPKWEENKKGAVSALVKDFLQNRKKISEKHNEIYSNAKSILDQTISSVPLDRPVKVIVTPLFTSGGTPQFQERCRMS